MSFVVREIHLARHDHAQFVFGDLLDSLRRLELRDFDAKPFVFQFELLRLILRFDERVTPACANPAAYDDCHCQYREDDERHSTARTEQVIQSRLPFD